jgi:MoxR-like ATPase
VEQAVQSGIPALAWVEAVGKQFGSVIAGHDVLLRRMISAALTGQHVLIEGVPGLGKTLAVLTLARSLDASFRRIQFTADLLPSDITGSLIYDAPAGRFTPHKGPIFANIVLADEINRAPAKVQSALLEAMQERQVTIGDASFPLPNPFLVLATENPIEQEGTYGLPEAQLDRFLFQIVLGYPEIGQERLILDRMALAEPDLHLEPAAHTGDVLAGRRLVDQVHLEPKLRDYIISLADASRHPSKYGLDIQPLIRYGASPRGCLLLALAAKAEAFLSGRRYVIPRDVKEVAPDVLRHRLLLTYEAKAENVTASDLVARILSTVEVP